MALNIHLYGFLKKKFDPQAKMSENTIITVDYVPGEQFSQLLTRLHLEKDEMGDCFINNKVVSENTLVQDNARIALFGTGMNLLCGGQHLKGHGYIAEKPLKKINYF